MRHLSSSTRGRARAALLLALFATGCAGAAHQPADADADGDAADDRFLTGANVKADVAGIEDGSAAACAVLKLASTASLARLDDEASLNARAAKAIYKARIGLDGQPDTADDVWFDTLAALDHVKYVGPKAFKQLLAHTDATDFSCGQVQVQLLATNDFHGNLKPPAGSSGRINTGVAPNPNPVDAGGAEFLATHMKRLEATNPNTLIVAAGDIVGATPLLSALFHDEPTVESMNLIGLDVASVGNHEFDEGADELLRMQGGGCHPQDGCQDGDDFGGANWNYLSANVIDDATGDTLLPPYEIRRFGMARVAFIGMTLEGTPLVTTPTGTAGLSFLDEADTVNALVPELKAQGVNAIVVLLHEGGLATGLYNECAGISGPLFDIVRHFDAAVDVVIAGHTNAAHLCDIDGKLVTSAASFGRLITDIDLTVDEVSGEVVAKTGQNVIVTRDVDKASEQTQLIARYDAIAAPLANRVVGRIGGDLVKLQNLAGQSNLGDVIADAQLAATRTSGQAVLAVMNPGGIRTDLITAQVSGGEAPGELTYGEMFAVQPFSNVLVTISLTGAQILAALEQQWVAVPGAAEKVNILQVSADFAYTWDASKPIGSRVDVSSVLLGGVALDPAATYRVTMNNFLADGGDGFSAFKAGTDRAAGSLDVDALGAYVEANSSVAPLAPPTAMRITRLN
jgi:5'-nucleotidase